MNEIPEDIAVLDAEAFHEAAVFAAQQLATRHCAAVVFGPGDMTEYKISIVKPPRIMRYGQLEEPRYYWVSLLGFGAGYEWAGGPVDYGYAAEKWTQRGESRGTREWTGAVVARFLTELSRQLKEYTI